MKKFVVVPVNGYKNILPQEEIASGSESTALKKFLQEHSVPCSGIMHVTDTVLRNWRADGYNDHQIQSSIDFIVDKPNNIQNGLVINKKKSNAYKLY